MLRDDRHRKCPDSVPVSERDGRRIGRSLIAQVEGFDGGDPRVVRARAREVTARDDMRTNVRLYRDILAAWKSARPSRDPTDSDDEPRGTESVTRIGPPESFSSLR